MIKIIYNAQTKEVTEIEVADEEMPIIKEAPQELTLEEKVALNEQAIIELSMLMGGMV